MFDRFNDAARRVVVLAQEEARLLNHHHVDTEHLLLGLFEMRGTTGEELLERLQLYRALIRHAIVEISGPGTTAPIGHIAWRPRAKETFELAVRESLLRGDAEIGDEHLLLGLLRQNEGIASLVLFAAQAGRTIRAESEPAGMPRRPDLTVETARAILDSIRPASAPAAP